MKRPILACFVALVLPGVVRAADLKTDELAAAYAACTDEATKEAANAADVIAKCTAPATAGVPGAQYAMGAMLMNRDGKPTAEATQWLEKAVAQGHAGAAYILATVENKRDDAESRQRAQTLLRMAICGEYVPAVAEAKKVGLTRESLNCPKHTDTNFDGEWSGVLGPPKGSSVKGPGSELRLTINGSDVHVYVRVGGSWLDVKPGKFKVEQVEETMVVSVLDSGSDFDGKWIESWTIHLLRLSDDEAFANYVRTVNNRDMPPRFSWRKFTNIAEGTMRRTAATR